MGILWARHLLSTDTLGLMPCFLILGRVSARDSGKPMVDAAFGEVMVTCEKIWWLVKEGRQYLQPERRKAGAMVRRCPL